MDLAWACWARAAESYLHARLRGPGAVPEAYRGRAEEPRYRRTSCSRAAPGSGVRESAEVRLRGTLARRLSEMLRLGRAGVDHEAQALRLLAKVKRALRGKDYELFGADGDFWKDGLQQISAATAPELEGLAEQAQVAHQRALAHLTAERERSWTEWCHRALEGGGGQACRWAKDEFTDAIACVEKEGGELEWDPRRVAEHAAEQWSALWKPVPAEGATQSSSGSCRSGSANSCHR